MSGCATSNVPEVQTTSATREELEETYDSAVFAGGCFWCVEEAFDTFPGVIEAISGYTNGGEIRPTYQDVAQGKTDFVESVTVYYDADERSYQELLEHFFHQINPTDDGGQFADRGEQYRPMVFFETDTQRDQIREYIKQLEDQKLFGNDPIVVEVVPRNTFFEAEAYHQNYHKTHPVQYMNYKRGSGRSAYIKRVWK
jgi:methionine-S-sulfoxide reductase